MLEVLVALALLGVIVAIAFPGLRAVLVAWQRGADHASGLDDIAIVERFVRQQLEQALPVYRAREGATALDFAGKNDQIDFVAPLAQIRTVPGLYRQTLTTITGQDGTSAFGLRYRLWNAGNEEVVDHVLLDTVSGLRFEYQGAGKSAWSPGWSVGLRMPARVRVSFTHSNRRWWWDIPIRAQGAGSDAPTS